MVVTALFLCLKYISVNSLSDSLSQINVVCKTYYGLLDSHSVRLFNRLQGFTQDEIFVSHTFLGGHVDVN